MKTESEIKERIAHIRTLGKGFGINDRRIHELEWVLKDKKTKHKETQRDNITISLPVDKCRLLIERITHINRVYTDEEKAERLIELIKATGFEIIYKDQGA